MGFWGFVAFLFFVFSSCFCFGPFLLFVLPCAFVCICICTSTHLQFRRKMQKQKYYFLGFFILKNNSKSCDFAFVFCFCLLLFVSPCAFVCTGICTSTHLHFAQFTKSRIIIFQDFLLKSNKKCKNSLRFSVMAFFAY